MIMPANPALRAIFSASQIRLPAKPGDRISFQDRCGLYYVRKNWFNGAQDARHPIRELDETNQHRSVIRL